MQRQCQPSKNITIIQTLAQIHHGLSLEMCRPAAPA
jgi:hypothetical protein